MYQLTHKLGAGGMGVVYAANKVTHPEREPLQVAVKVLRTDLPGLVLDQAGDMFYREAVTSWRVNHSHLNLVTVYDFGFLDGGTPYLVMERIDGVRLDYFEREPGPDCRVIRRLAYDVLSALEHLHDHGLLHRDVTPRNILVSHAGIAMLTDLGLVKEHQGSISGCFGGTPAYASLEALQSRKQAPASDLYSLGAVLYERITGRKPYGEGSPDDVLRAMRECKRSPLPDDVPEDLASLVDGLLTLEVDERPFQTAAKAIRHLDGPMAEDHELAALVALSPLPEPDTDVPELGWPFCERLPEPAPESKPELSTQPPRRAGWPTVMLLALVFSLGTLGLGLVLGRMTSTTVSAEASTAADIPSTEPMSPLEPLPPADVVPDTSDEPSPTSGPDSDKPTTHRGTSRYPYSRRALMAE